MGAAEAEMIRTGTDRRRTEGQRRPESRGGSRRNLPTRRRQQNKVGKRWRFLAVLTFCLVIFNALFLSYMYLKVKSMDELLNRAAVQLNEPEGQKESQTQQEYQVLTGSVTGQTVKEDYPDIWGLEWVDSPVERTGQQVLERLSALAEESEIIEEIYRNRDRYPDKLLEALANNPEMAGFVAGYLDGDKSASGGLTESEQEKDFPLFLQWDPRWGYAEYGDDSNIGIAGCGPACISMALYYLTRNENLTPDVIADYSMTNGYYVSGVGTAWALLEDVPALYGIEVSQLRIREENMKQALEEGGILICSMSAGDFTASGHFIVIYGYDSQGFLVNDPNCVARSRTHWEWERLERQMKNLWAYSNNKGVVSYYDSPL